MDHKSAITLLQRLADGIDPATGEVFAADSPYQRPETVRALYAAISALREEPTRRPTGHPRSGQPWTDDEETRLLAAFDQGRKPGTLTGEFGRSEVAITARLVKLGRMEAPPNLRFNEPGPGNGHAPRRT